MKVYVLFGVAGYESSSLLGVYLSKDEAKSAGNAAGEIASETEEYEVIGYYECEPGVSFEDGFFQPVWIA